MCIRDSYRRVLAEVLGSSMVLQLLGLASPLVFQVVIDKVLVHRGVSTLDVLVVALVLLSTFECVLSILRNYVFAHTANRIDVELGARLYNHLMALPVPYFVARRVGDSVARVREPVSYTHLVGAGTGLGAGVGVGAGTGLGIG